MNRKLWLLILMSGFLAGCGPAGNNAATSDTGQAANEPVTTDTEQAVEEPVTGDSDNRRTGLFRYMADAAMFEDCKDGKRFPVAMEGAYIELERAYLNSGIEPGSPLRVELEGRYLERPGMEENTREISLLIDSFIAISDDETCTPLATASLYNTYWKLIELHGEPVKGLEGQREPHMVLAEADGSLRGHGGCNRFSGAFTLDDERLSFGPLIMTEMACINGMETEAAFLDALSESDNYSLRGETLELYRGQDLLARFEAVYL